MTSVKRSETLPQETLNGTKEEISIQLNGVNSNGVPAWSPLENLAHQVMENSKIMSDFLRSSGHPQPSFEREAPPSTLPDFAPEHIRDARTKLMEVALRTFQLALGPKEYIPNLAVGVSIGSCCDAR